MYMGKMNEYISHVHWFTCENNIELSIGFSHVNLFPTYVCFTWEKTEGIYATNNNGSYKVFRTNRYKKNRTIYYMIF